MEFSPNWHSGNMCLPNLSLNPRGAIHELKNVGDTPVRVVNTLVVDKGKPRMQPASQ
jgi:hypothetical protein